ncbi:MAG TPA: polyprenyl synthetase family protein [Phototrophicaceae bacterium]|nr:polyprenyl synthetase family protein [Phototrophicaceae bacterium]
MNTAQPSTAAMPEVLQHALQQVETLMFDVVDSEVAVLRDASRHIISAGGKRIRPRLVLLAYAAAGGVDPAAAAPIAAAVELVHTASVVHDDINDHGIVRRGRPSVNAKWGRTFALLTGDFLFTKVYELMAPFKDLNVILADATVALVEGETLQASAVKENNFTREVYYRIIAKKTAALFQASGELGARLANGSAEQVKALASFGYNLGLAFQIIDDVLDLTGDTEQLGKTSGIDVEQGRGFAVAHEGVDVMTSLKEKVLQGDAIQEAHDQAQQLVELAINYLNVLPDSDAKDGLVGLAHLVIDRSF